MARRRHNNLLFGTRFLTKRLSYQKGMKPFNIIPFQGMQAFRLQALQDADGAVLRYGGFRPSIAMDMICRRSFRVWVVETSSLDVKRLQPLISPDNMALSFRLAASHDGMWITFLSDIERR